MAPLVNIITRDLTSIEAIKDIRRRSVMSVALSRIMPIGTLVSIFLGNGTLKSAYNISQTDFKLLAEAMMSIPTIQRKVILDIARMQALLHTGKESQFWKGVADGCSTQ